MEKIEPFITEEQIKARVQEMGREIRKDFQGEEVVLLCILKGAFIFCSDLMRSIQSPVQVEFLKASSYGDQTESSGEVQINYQFSKSLEDKNVIIIEDIVDTGITLKALMKSLLAKERPRSLKLASLLSKPERRVHQVDIDYLGFEIEDKFVIGYGLDYAQNYRELPFIGIYSA